MSNTDPVPRHAVHPPIGLQRSVNLKTTVTLSNLSRIFSVPEPVLLQQALAAWLTTQLADVEREITALVEQYGTDSPDAMEAMIRDGVIVEHPSWEDTISLESLQIYRDKLRQQMAESGASNDQK